MTVVWFRFDRIFTYKRQKRNECQVMILRARFQLIYLYTANYQRRSCVVPVVSTCMFVCNRHSHLSTPIYTHTHTSYTGALFKRQRIDENLWQWRAGHSWVSISLLSLWTPGSTAAQHNTSLSPPPLLLYHVEKWIKERKVEAEEEWARI